MQRSVSRPITVSASCWAVRIPSTWLYLSCQRTCLQGEEQGRAGVLPVNGFTVMESQTGDVSEWIANTDYTDGSASARSGSNIRPSLLESDLDNGTNEQTDTGGTDGRGVPSGTGDRSAVTEQDGSGIGC